MFPIQKKVSAPKGYRLEYREPKEGELFLSGTSSPSMSLEFAVVLRHQFPDPRWVIVPEKTTVVTFDGDVSDLFRPGADGEFVVSAKVVDVEVV